MVFKTLILLLGAMFFIYACSAMDRKTSRVDERVHSIPVTEASIPELGEYRLPSVLDPRSIAGFETIIPYLANKQVVYIGETHDRFDHHLNQLEIIRRLHEIHPDLAIGMEFFQQPFQSHLDAYVAGELSEKEFLKASEYYERWRFDYRLYRPILRYAQRQRIPLVALNLPREITSKVGHSGLSSLTEQERLNVPADIDPSDTDYRHRLQKIFEQHPELDFEHFYEAQLLWDEGMAQRAADYLRNNPKRHLVVLAGSGHLSHGSGIPQRVKRRIDIDSAIILNGVEAGIEPGIADYLLLPQPLELPPKGFLGIYMSDTPEGVTVNSFTEGSAAEQEGMEKGDQIMSLGGESVESSADIKIALMDKRPGDYVKVGVRRKDDSQAERRLVFNVGLK